MGLVAGLRLRLTQTKLIMKNILFVLPTLSGRKSRALLGMATLAVGFPTAYAQNGSGEEADVVLEQFTVTGSRIKRIDTETPAPVIRLTTADFESTGFSTLGLSLIHI